MSIEHRLFPQDNRNKIYHKLVSESEKYFKNYLGNYCLLFCFFIKKNHGKSSNSILLLLLTLSILFTNSFICFKSNSHGKGTLLSKIKVSSSMLDKLKSLHL